jgi:hypothetical protein
MAVACFQRFFIRHSKDVSSSWGGDVVGYSELYEAAQESANLIA